VKYAIHPVAGRMPGHMNVLLAEADVPYEQLKEMDEINPEFPTTDVVLVVGANDVVNPAARTPGTPISGMPILNVDQAQSVVFLKRSMRPGFAGIDNELLYDPKTQLLFGDAKDSLGKVVTALHERLDHHRLPAGYSYFWNGMQKQMGEMQSSIVTALLLAVAFIFMVLASQFESLVHPFTIMLSLPLALVGAILGLWLTRNTLGMGADIGIILLMGLVTKNAILLVDGALQNLRAGDDPLTAMRKAGPRRLRPILMTSSAMVLGMLPTALGRGIGSEFRAPMAIAVIGGVITSTLLTLWVVPVVFLWIERFRRRRTLMVVEETPAAPAEQAAGE